MDVASDADYILGHDDVERRRLQAQGDFIERYVVLSLPACDQGCGSSMSVPASAT